MNLAHYFNPSEALPCPNGLRKESSLYGKLNRSKDINLSDSTIAIMGVPESRNSNNPSASLAPDIIRKYLYALSGAPIKSNLVDLGNLKSTENPANTYMAIRDVVSYLAKKGVTVILLGGTQELTWATYQGVQEHVKRLNISVIDYCIDLGYNDGDFSSSCYLNKLISEPTQQLFTLNVIGYQGYLTDSEHINLLSRENQGLYRLGAVRSAMAEVEPALRDSHIVSFDMSSIRQSDSPGSTYGSPNGLYAEEACQLARYAGLSREAKVFGLYELNVSNDVNHQSSRLAAQITWHFLESAFQPKVTLASLEKSEGIKKYFIGSPIPNIDLIFIHNRINDTWWIEIPANQNHPDIIIACSYNDYRMASNGETPDRWLNALKKLA